MDAKNGLVGRVCGGDVAVSWPDGGGMVGISVKINLENMERGNSSRPSWLTVAGDISS